MLTILVTTYFPPELPGIERLRVFEQTLRSWEENLQYSGEINLHIADDGSKDHLYDLFEKAYSWKFPLTGSRQERHGLGASLNLGLKKVFETSPLVFYAGDDWMLTEPLDITPWCKLLEERQDVGMVRLGPPHPGLTGTIEMFTDNWQGWGLRLNKNGYCFATRPFILHQRFYEIYGPFPENCSAIEMNRVYNDTVCSTKGPDIVLALPHKFFHLDSIDLSEVQPCGGKPKA